MPLFLILVLILAPAAASAQVNNGRKQANAVRVPTGSINLDGRLDDRAWGDVPALTDFVQKEPVEGAPPTDGMDVRFAYDDRALYVGARMSSDEPIQAPMGPRDSGEQAEHLLISLDTYLDRRTSSTFGVTAAGVRLDSYYPQDDDWPSDPGFNPVWQVRTAMDEGGWTAELWIPFSQLRFTDRDTQIWGLNIERWVPSRNEEVSWVPISRTEERRTSLFGDLHGISGIRPSRRLELLPYVASSSQRIGQPDPDDPFASGADLQGRVGLDAKVGLGSNLTLEATVNPDFGQVEADPAEVNLSAFETFFDERRPFFIEGSDLLQGSVNNYFYSRRIGAPPAGRASGDFVDYPATSTILGAAKLTGRLASGLSVGMLGAVTDEESARTFRFPSQFGSVRVAPRTTYGVARLQQEFGPEGSTTAVMGTTVHRGLDDTDPLASLLTRNAFTISSDSLIRLADGNYELQLNAGVAHVDGAPAAIDRLQRASARYLHRPDADYLAYDPLRTSMTGMKVVAGFERRNARHWLWQAGVETETPEFETNDLGRLSSGDNIGVNTQVEYRETRPGRWLRNYSVSLEPRAAWNYGGEVQQLRIDPRARLTWRNFWGTNLSGWIRSRSQNMRLTRGGPSMEQPAGWEADIEVQSSDAAETRGDASVTYGRNEDGGLTFQIDGEMTMQPGPQWQLSISPEYERLIDTQQYVTTLPGGTPATFGGRYVFADVDRSTYATQIRLTYTFKPDLTLDFYGEPFSASGRYDHVGELAAARTRLRRVYGTEGTTLTTLADGSQRVADGATNFTLRSRDFNVQSFRSNLVLRWEWRPGSTLYLVWQQDRSAEEALRDRTSVADMFSSFRRPGDHFFAIKTSFWFSPR
jgi:hypothetical protein